MMSTPVRLGVAAVALVAPVIAAQVPSATEPTYYAKPPQAIIDAFDAEPLPQTIVSPNRQLLAITSARAYPTIAELSQPMLRLAGARINPNTNGPFRSSGLAGTGIYAISLKHVTGGADVAVAVPSGATITQVQFSPDSSRLAFLNTTPTGIELWIADTATGAARSVLGADHVNALTGNDSPPRRDACEWQKDSASLACQLVPAGRGPAPSEPTVPAGPNIQENDGKAAPAPTYEDLLKTVHDDELFAYYFTSQLAFVTVTGTKTPVGKPAIFEDASISPDGAYALVSTIRKPFSHLVPMNGFPKDVDIWTRGGERVKTLASLPSHEGTPIGGVEPGPRTVHWRSDVPATVEWVEALDGGNPRTRAAFRDAVRSLASPFTGAPAEIARTEWRFARIQYTDGHVALLSEADRVSRRTRTWLIEPGAAPKQAWDRKQDSAYDDPGRAVTRGDTGTSIAADTPRVAPGSILQKGDFIYFAGVGSSPEGDRPFLDRLNVKTLKTERLFHSGGEALESFVAGLNDDMTRILTRAQTQKDVPNYYVRDLASGSRTQVTRFSDPQPQVRAILRQFITYKRADGVTLSATLYLPPGYKQGQKAPLVMWAYPREFGDADTASQVTGSPNQFTLIRGASHLFLLLSGYAVLDNPTMPIIGPGETANDTYVEQLVASAQAAVDKVVEMGVTDRDHIGIGGHSYGGFMTANLLAHSRLFRAGFAESGAYNRSLTPFGFQNERRTFWDVPDLYAKMSPFWYAQQIKDPILLMHGEADDNTGTYPINSERLYAAIKGLGGTVRLVMLPNEAHGYAARETLLHVLAERLNWFDRYVKNGSVRNSTAQ